MFIFLMKRFALLSGIIFFCVATSYAQYSATAACPTTGPTWTIYGYGAGTTGGCQSGRTHLVVDTLTDVVDTSATSAAALLSNKGADGKISLREALYGGSVGHAGDAGPRLITFSVSGNISLGASFELETSKYDDITMDGGDAPNGGVQIINQDIQFRCSNIILRHMKFRRGESTGEGDSVGFIGTGSTSDVVIDHCSIELGADGDVDITDGYTDWTVQFSLFGNNFGSGSTLIKYGGNTRGTLFKNLYVQSGGRAPKYEEGEGQVVNNVVYRSNNTDMPGFSVATVGTNSDNPSGLPVIVDVIKNYYKMGPGETMGGGGAATLNIWDNVGNGDLSVYLFGNLAPERPTDTGDEWLIAYNYVAADKRLSPIVGAPTLPIVSAAQAYTDVTTGDTGASEPCRDSLDTSLVNDTINGASRHHPSTVAAAGGYPNLTLACPAEGGTPSSTKGRLGTKGRAKLQ